MARCGQWGLAGWNAELVALVCAEPRLEGAARMGLIHPVRGLYGYWWRDAESFHDTRRRDWMARIPGSRAGQANVVYEKWALERRYLGTWHSPLLLFADYNAGINRWYALGCSTITYVSVGFMLAWLTLKSDRLWPAALFHAWHNLFVPIIFDNLVRNTGPTLWYTTQFGAGLAATSSAFALCFWTRRRDVQPVTADNVTVQSAAFAYEHFEENAVGVVGHQKQIPLS